MAEDRLYEKARKKAFRLLALRGRSTSELRVKLKDGGFEEPVIQKVVSGLRELQYLDDAVFAREWARNLAVNRLYGNRLIDRSLQEKGIARELIKEAITQIREEIPERKALRILLKKKLKDRKIADLDMKEKNRLAQSLMGKGFPADLIFYALGNKEDEELNERE